MSEERPGKIIIVEDEPFQARFLTLTLKKAGFEIIDVFDNGKANLDYLKNNPHDAELILMDIMLKGALDGIETAEAVKTNHDIQVIFLSGLTDDDVIDRANVSTPHTFLFKPVDPRQLVTSVLMGVRSHRLSKDLRESRTWFSRTLDNIQSAIITTDRVGNIIFRNKKALEYFPDFGLPQNMVEELLVSNREGQKINYREVIKLKGSLNLESVILQLPDRNIPVDILLASITRNERILGYVIDIIDISEKKAQQDAIQKYQIQLQEFSDNLRNIQERERIKIAREIHDELGQYLARLKIDISRLKLDIEDNTRLNDLESIADTLVKRVRKVSSDLRPKILDDGTILEALDWLSKEFSQSLPVSFFCTEEVLHLPQELKTDIFRIAQESLSNILKHARATLATIELSLDDNTIELVIRDNGIGVKKNNGQKKKKTMGVMGMKERARRWKGQLNIVSSDNGTTVTASFPFQETDN